MNVKLMLTKKIGPLPAWAWGLVIGGGYVGYRILSGKGLSVTGTQSGTTNLVGEGEEFSPPEYGGPGTSYGSGGGVPSFTIINQIPDVGIATDSAAVARAKANAARQKERGDNWADYARKWKRIAKGTNKASVKKGSTRPKTQNTGVTKRVGTQGTHRIRPIPTAAPRRTQTAIERTVNPPQIGMSKDQWGRNG